MNTCILTARIDTQSQDFFDKMREQHFPKERNLLNAHLTLFHKLPDNIDILQTLEKCDVKSTKATVSNLKNIGHGVAYFIDCPELELLHQRLKKEFLHHLNPQDIQSIRLHITIQNKVRPEEARALLHELNQSFQPFEILIQGLDLWHYLDGPWQHYQYFPFHSL